MTGRPQRIPPQQDLLAFIDEQERRLIESEYDVAKENIREFEVLYGLCAQAIRYAAAFAVLHRADRKREAVVLARQAMEHAATAQWAHFTDGGIDRLIATLRATHLSFYSKMSLWLENDELAELVNADRQRTGGIGKGMPPVTDRLRTIDQKQMLETVYLQQSQLVHVTSSSTTGFLVDGEKELRLVPNPGDPHEANSTYIAAMAAMFAAWLIEFFVVGQPGMERLDKQSDELLLPINVGDAEGLRSS